MKVDIFNTNKKYSIIYADPPWQYKVWSNKGHGRSAESHYPTMTKIEIQNLPIPKICENNSVLFLWVTYPCLEEGLVSTVIENHEKVTAILEGDTNRTICLNSKSGRNGIDGLQPSRKDRIYSSDGIACTIATNDFYNPNYLVSLILAYKIRKLTPKECWRLMGFNDEDFEKAAKVNSKTQLYKQAGNSIVANVLMAIFNNLLKGK